MLLNKIQQPYKKLGFHGMEASEITSKLNVVLSSYQVFYHKLQNFHWNVLGSEFFDVHDITSSLYEETAKNVDTIAERIRLFGAVPNYRLNDYLRDSAVKEISNDRNAHAMMTELIIDLQKLIETLLDAHEFASRHGDIGSLYILQKQTYDLESYYWKLTSWTNKMYI